VDIRAECDRSYLPAYHQSGFRPISQIRWVVIHDEESPTAESAARYFKERSSGGSAHLCIDDQHCFRTLKNTTIPWAASSSFGANTHGFHLELAGYARWVPGQWLLHKNTIERAAYKTALHLKKFNLPVQWVDANGLLKGLKGVTSHNEISAASRKQDPHNAWRYSHYDPGKFFPRRRFMSRVAAFYAEM
jgi:hypothetical protein